MCANDAVEDHLEDALPQSRRRHAERRELAADVGQVQASQSIVYGDRHDRSVVDVERSLLDALLQDAAQDVELADIQTTTGMLELNHVAEKLGLERAVAYHRVAHLVEAADDVALELLVGRDLEGRDLLDGLDDVAHLAIDDRQENLGLRLEVGIERATSLARRGGDLVHRRVVEALRGKQLASHFNQF